MNRNNLKSKYQAKRMRYLAIFLGAEDRQTLGFASFQLIHLYHEFHFFSTSCTNFFLLSVLIVGCEPVSSSFFYLQYFFGPLLDTVNWHCIFGVRVLSWNLVVQITNSCSSYYKMAPYFPLKYVFAVSIKGGQRFSKVF